MDRSWMFADRLTKEYEDGVEEFIEFAVNHAANPDAIVCPCVKCCNSKRMNVVDLRDHLIINGIDENYRQWIWHGEGEDVPTNDCGAEEEFEAYQSDRLEDMLHVVEENFQDNPEMFENMKCDAQTPLYDGCKYTRLSTLLMLYNLKAGNGWSDVSFTELLRLIKDILPQPNCLPDRTYEAKKVLCSMGMNYEKIHACPNDCILYRREYESLHNCPNPDCGLPRYKKARVPAKVLWYFPIIPRFRRFFSNVRDAENLAWLRERISDGKIRHPADSSQWKTIDHLFPDFGSEERNLRLALSTDGMNPHSSLSSTHSTWPVVMAIYNLPPWLCMKRKYMMLTLLISGPKQPGNDIDVYLAPLVEDLKYMWEHGVEVYDAHRKEHFNLRAMLFCTINDFPAYGNLSGYSTHGHLACPICGADTYYCQLKHGQKTVYLGHRRFLPLTHHYRKRRKAFNGNTEEERAPKALNGEQVFDMVKDLDVRFGKKSTNQPTRDNWRKRSVFFELPYWKHLYIRHCLDVMHIEKNVCDNLVGTLLNVPGKTKDDKNARWDMLDMNIRKELAPVERGSRTYLPPASYTLSKKEKSVFCEFLHSVKVPDRYSSNIRNFVSLKDLKLVGMKSHDCHILIQQFLPVAIRSILPKHVRTTITRLCFFFNKLCSKVIDPSELNVLQNEIVVTLCQLEMHFPPSWFTIMVHLTVHLVREVQLCGPVYLRWMYPFERYMKVLKGYVKNRNRPEGCIVERYIVEEAIDFCRDYLSDANAIGLPKPREAEREDGKGIAGKKLLTISLEMRRQAHLYVLHNSEEVIPYVDKHMEELRDLNSRRSELWIAKQHNHTFIEWFEKQTSDESTIRGNRVSTTLKSLAQKPSVNVFSYKGYVVNNITFYTEDQDERSTMQNSGVTLVAEGMHRASAKDKNPINASMAYYGVIEDIWELDYATFSVPVLYCKWVDSNNGVRVDEFGFVLVDLNRTGHKDDSFILASQAKQVFYVPDPIDPHWSKSSFQQREGM